MSSFSLFFSLIKALLNSFSPVFFSYHSYFVVIYIIFLIILLLNNLFCIFSSFEGVDATEGLYVAIKRGHTTIVQYLLEVTSCNVRACVARACVRACVRVRVRVNA